MSGQGRVNGMTTMVDKPTRRTFRGSGVQGDSSAGPVIPPPPRLRRRWGVFAAMAALVSLGALGNVWLVQATSNASEVLAARVAIERGQVITAADVMSVRVGTDPALRPVPATDQAAVVGKRAATDVAAGTLLTPDAATSENLPTGGRSLVGVGIAPAAMPGVDLAAGDRVRVVGIPTQPGESPGAGGSPGVVSAVVVHTATGGDSAGAGGVVIVTLEVPTGDAASLAAMAAGGKVAIVLDSRDR